MTAVPPLLDAAMLRAAGRVPPVPFRIALADGEAEGELVVRRVLRVLPGRRIVGEAERHGRRLLAKLFFDARSERYWQREHAGVKALAAAGIPTPRLEADHGLGGGGHVVLTEFLDDAETVLDAWRQFDGRPPGDHAAMALLVPMFELLGRLHGAGLSHGDLHLDNFLRHNTRLYLIDAGSVRAHGAGPLPEQAAARDLAMLLAQLPRTWDAAVAPLLDAYRAASLRPLSDAALRRALVEARAWRLRDFLSKTVRGCSLFKVVRRFDRFTAVLRSDADAFELLLADPDRWMETGTVLKRGNTCTVCRVRLGDRELVIKRYNLKSLRHALSRVWRPSRGWHSWREGHRLALYGIATPTPLALVEERKGPLRGRAWLITEYCGGADLLGHLDPSVPPPPVIAAALRTLFATLHRVRISHGDLKATNLLWDGREIKLIDLDAMCQHRSAAGHARAWRRDRLRLLRNWPAGSELHRWLDGVLPP